MKTRVQKCGNGYGVVLPKKAIERLGVTEGDMLTISRTDSGILLSPVDGDFSDQLQAFRRIEARHRKTLRKLAQ